MQTQPTDTAMSATELTPETMLQHLFMSCRKMQLHLTAYSAATATREMVSDDDVPDEDCYEYEKDRSMTDEMLLISKELVERLEQHRATYYPGLPAFEQLTVNTTPDWEGGTPRLHNNNEPFCDCDFLQLRCVVYKQLMKIDSIF